MIMDGVMVVKTKRKMRYDLRKIDIHTIHSSLDTLLGIVCIADGKHCEIYEESN